MTREEAIQWLKMESSKPIKWDDYSEERKRIREDAERHIAKAFAMAIDALKAQEPRVMTLVNLREIGSVWELNTAPYLWMEVNPSYRWTRGFWVAWREIYDMIDGLHPTYDADNYGKTWRCWSSRPDEKRRAETPWN